MDLGYFKIRSIEVSIIEMLFISSMHSEILLIAINSLEIVNFSFEVRLSLLKILTIFLKSLSVKYLNIEEFQLF